MASEERLRELEEKYEGYKVYDNRGEKIGKVDDLFVDESDNEEYIGVKLGLFGMKSTLIPMDIVRVNEADKAIEVSDTKDHVKDAPTFDDDEEVTTEYENRIRSHFGLEALGTSGSYGAYSGAGSASDTDTDSDETTSRSSGTSAEYTGDEEHTDEDSSTAASEGSDTGYDERSESSSGSSTGGSTGAFGGESGGDRETSGRPTSRQTEETETVEEDGRTKVRRRVVREEIVEEDQNS